jgi:hypothetical protein
MTWRDNDKRSRLFTVRVWPEEISAGHTEWRGKIQRVGEGDAHYFHDWQTMLAFLLQTLDPPSASEEAPTRPHCE